MSKPKKTSGGREESAAPGAVRTKQASPRPVASTHAPAVPAETPPHGSRFGTVIVDEDVRVVVKAAIDRHGTPKVARAIGISVEACGRVAGGLTIRAGTAELAKAKVNLGKLDALDQGRTAA